jgi:mannose-6-phosphate isomerase-like protein (cupin superfamily)
MLIRSIYNVDNTPAYNGTVDQWRLYREGELLSTINGINANVIAPGTGSLSHRHEHTEHIYYILGGKGIVIVGDEEREVTEGDAVYMPPRLDHSIKNTGTYPLRFLAITADEKPGN